MRVTLVRETDRQTSSTQPLYHNLKRMTKFILRYVALVNRHVMEGSAGPPAKCNLCESCLTCSSFSLSRQRLRGNYKRWRCLECDFPPCQRCGEVPTQPKSAPYTCQACSYPPCRCGAPRKHKNAHHVSNLKNAHARNAKRQANDRMLSCSCSL